MSTLKFGFTAKQMIEEGRIRGEEIAVIKQWSLTKKLPELTEEQIVLFLISCDNNEAATKKTIGAYYTCRKKSSVLFDGRMIKDSLQKQLENIEVCVFPQRTEDGCAVIFGRLYDTYYGNFDLTLSIKAFFMTLDAALHDHPPKGLVILLDMEGVGVMHITKFKPWIAKMFFEYLQEALPVQLKIIHVLNTAYFIDKIMFILKPFMNKDVREKLNFHPINMDMETFYENWLPKRCLPEDYGGDLPTVRALHEKNIKRLTELEPHFVAEEEHRKKNIGS